MAKVIKGAGNNVWDEKSRRKMHGSDPKWQGQVARGGLRRMSEKPGQHQRRKP